MTSSLKKNALIVFAKPPVAGLAKTRLIPALGEAGAANYHAKLLNHTLKNVTAEKEWDTYLWCSEAPDHPFFQVCLSQYIIGLKEQAQGDLGERMAQAMKKMLAEYDRVCLIGSDCPVLDRDKIRAVFACLTSKEDVAITPAEDGGYVLIAVTGRLNPEIFSGVQWGGENVFQQTLQNLQRLQLNAVVQPTLWDVDTPEDLKRIKL